MAPKKRMGKKPADVSDPSETTEVSSPCDRCRTDATADPCGPCPLYRAYLERSELADAPAVRAAYDAWATSGGWRIVWGLHRLTHQRAARLEVMSLLAGYPRVNPAIVAHMLEVGP
jgi:hypothetical protein